MEAPRFLSLDEVFYLHDESLRRFEGISGVGNVGLVESALGSAQNVFWYNKRTGAAAAIMFLKLNGIHLPRDDGSLYTALIDVANKKMDKVGLAKVLGRLAEKENES